MTSTADALFPAVRQRVLAVLFGSPDRSFYANELIALARSGTGAVQRELASLLAAGLVTVRDQGNQKHYQAKGNWGQITISTGWLAPAGSDRPPHARAAGRAVGGGVRG